MESIIIAIALANQVDPNLLLAVCYKETRFVQIDSPNDGGSTSYGPCQIKQISARQVASTGDVRDLEDSIDIAAKYLSYNIKRCHGVEAGIAAYNYGHCKPTTIYSRSVLVYYKQFQNKYFYYTFDWR